MINDPKNRSLLGYIVRDESGTVYLSSHMSSNQIASHEEAQKIINELMSFYAFYTPEEVRSHNITAEKNWYAETYPKQSGD